MAITTASTYVYGDYYYDVDAWYEQKQKELLAKKKLLEESKLLKPKLMEFNIKAKGGKPPFTPNKVYIKSDIITQKYKAQYEMGSTVKGVNGAMYYIDEDENGVYWYEIA